MNPKNRTSLLRAPARMFLAVAALGAVALPTLAASSGQPEPTLTAQNARPAQSSAVPDARAQDTTLKVSYYAGDPRKGGKLISTVTLTRPQRAQGQGRPAGTPGQAQTRPAPGTADSQRTSRPNPIVDQAPKGATFAVVRDARGGTRTIDLTHPGFGMRGPGGPDQMNRTQTGGETPPTR